MANWTWKAGESDQAEAEKVVERNGLRADTTIRGLIQQRGHHANLLTGHEFMLDISTEARQDLSLVLDLEPYLTTGFFRTKFTGKFNQLKDQLQNLTLKVRVQFTDEVPPRSWRHGL